MLGGGGGGDGVRFALGVGVAIVSFLFSTSSNEWNNFVLCACSSAHS